MASFPAPRPGPGTQEVLSEHEQWGTSECPASLFSSLASLTLGTPVPLLQPGATPPHPWVLPAEGTRGPTVSQTHSRCVPPPPGLRLAVSVRLGLPMPWASLLSLGQPALPGSCPGPHSVGGGISFRRSLCLFPPYALFFPASLPAWCPLALASTWTKGRVSCPFSRLPQEACAHHVSLV